MTSLEEIKADQKRTAAFLRMEITPDVQWLISECERLTADNEKMKRCLQDIMDMYKDEDSYAFDDVRSCSANCLASMKRGEG